MKPDAHAKGQHMSTYNIISAASHNNTPRGRYEKYGAASLRDRMPRVGSAAQGDFGVFEGNRRPAVVGLSAMAGRSFEKYTAGALRFEEVRPGSWDTRARVEDQQLDGLDAEVIYYSGITGADTADLE